MNHQQTQLHDNLYVSDIQTISESPLDHADIVVSVCQDAVRDNVNCEYEQFPLADGEAIGRFGGDDSYEAYERAVDYVVDQIKRDNTVHVHCHNGMSRSVSVVTATLATLQDEAWIETYSDVEQAHPVAQPDPQLRRYGIRYTSEDSSSSNSSLYY